MDSFVFVNYKYYIKSLPFHLITSFCLASRILIYFAYTVRRWKAKQDLTALWAVL